MPAGAVARSGVGGAVSPGSPRPLPNSHSRLRTSIPFANACYGRFSPPPRGRWRECGETGQWYRPCCNAATDGRRSRRCCAARNNAAFDRGFGVWSLAPAAYLGFNLNNLAYLFVAASKTGHANLHFQDNIIRDSHHA
jgi:hypothetical protein